MSGDFCTVVYVLELGMTPITGSLPGQKIMNLVKNKLPDFNFIYEKAHYS